MFLTNVLKFLENFIKKGKGAVHKIDFVFIPILVHYAH